MSKWQLIVPSCIRKSLQITALGLKTWQQVWEKTDCWPCVCKHSIWNNHYGMCSLILCLRARFLLITWFPMVCACKQSVRWVSLLVQLWWRLLPQHILMPSTQEPESFTAPSLRIMPFIPLTHHCDWVSEVIDDGSTYCYAPVFCCLNCVKKKPTSVNCNHFCSDRCSLICI